jgi:hypothetical protein
MKRISIIAVFFVGLLTVLALVPTSSAQGARASVLPGGRLGLAVGPVSQHANSSGVLAASSGVTCTLSTTQTVGAQGNQSFASATLLSNALGRSLVPQTGVYPGTQVDVTSFDEYFFINAIAGNLVNVTMSPVNASAGNYNLGLTVYDGRNAAPPYPVLLIDENTNDFSASANFIAPFTGKIYFQVYQLNAATQCTGGGYNITFSNSTPTPTATGTLKPTATTGPTVTPYAGAPSSDQFEPNNSFDTATTIGLNVQYTGLNFVQWDINSDEWDNDYFRVRVKPGMLVTCRTLALTPGTDTNLILYDNNRNGINGSDDVNRAAGDLSSSVSYFVTYEGWLYGLVGEGFSRPLAEQAKTGYTYECTIGTQFTPTPAPTATDAPNMPTRTPITPTPTETLIPTPTLTPTPPFVRVEPLPTATQPGLPLSQVPVSLLTYYDANNSNKYDPGEGIVGISARVYDLTTGKLLAQGLTDETGRVAFTVSAPGAVQLVVPFLSFSDIILPSGKAVTVRVSGRELPRAIP